MITLLKPLISNQLTKKFIIITNQLAFRGIIKKEELAKINSFHSLAILKNKLNLLDIYCCYDHPDNASDFRKPGLVCFYKPQVNTI